MLPQWLNIVMQRQVSEMSVIEAVRGFIQDNCPFLEDFNALFPIINLDKLEENAPAYSIESVPSDPIVKRYMNGDSIRKLTFYLCSRNLYDVQKNVDTSEFYEKFSEWLEECNEEKNLPNLDNGKMAIKFIANTDGYVNDTAGTYAQYQIQCELRYFKPRRQKNEK